MLLLDAMSLAMGLLNVLRTGLISDVARGLDHSMGLF